MGGLKYPEAWFRVRGRCESEQHKSGPTSRAAGTARGPGPVSGCARWVFLLLLVLSLGQLHAETIVLHLKNGDRIAGTIISEDTNRVLLTNSWIKELAVPAAQIERRTKTIPCSFRRHQCSAFRPTRRSRRRSAGAAAQARHFQAQALER